MGSARSAFGTRRVAALSVLLLAAPVLSGCLAAAVGGAAATGAALTQERSLGSAISDFNIQARIEKKLLEYDSKTFRKVGTEVVEGRVLLTGRVATREERVDAAAIAWTTNGVREVVNELEVGASRGFGGFSTRIEARLFGDAGVEQENYNIETVNRTVYIFGIAQSEAELDRVIVHCRGVKGVRRVVPHVRMKDDSRRKEAPSDPGT
jgi:osmotically-inducible protein OsmY